MKQKRFIIAAVFGVIAALFVSYTFAQMENTRFTGATIEMRVVTVKSSDEKPTQTATETWYISESGARRQVRHDEATGKVLFEMMADPVRGAVYYVHRKSKSTLR